MFSKLLERFDEFFRIPSNDDSTSAIRKRASLSAGYTLGITCLVWALLDSSTLHQKHFLVAFILILGIFLAIFVSICVKYSLLGDNVVNGVFMGCMGLLGLIF